jgi:DNA replication protein DnaC
MAAERKRPLVMKQPRGMERPGTAPCSRCGGSGVVIAPAGGRATASVCDCSLHCKLCNNTRYIFDRDREGRDVARMCACEVRRVRVRLYNEAAIPAKYFDANLHREYQDADNHKAFEYLQNLARKYEKGAKGLVLMGAPGTGKTFLVCAFLRELILDRGVPAQFRDFFHLLADLRSGYSDDRPESELIGPLVDVEVLVIDELGKGRNTPWEQNILDVIISHRYNNDKTTVFTTNYTESAASTLHERLRSKDNPGEGEVVKDTLRERVGSRIHSRLREMCDCEMLRGKDRRPPAFDENAS